MKSLLLILSLFALLLIGCKREDIKPSSKDYLIFGLYISECSGGGGCIDIFKLERDQLLEDTNNNYPNSSSFYEGNYIISSQQKFIEAKDLLNNFPRELWKDSNQIIGQPDFKDQGGLYIEFKHNRKRRFWLIDTDKRSIPPNYHEFIDKVKATIERIK
jgi:hypothetical protein